MITCKINMDPKTLLALQRKADEAARQALEAQVRQVTAKSCEQLEDCKAAYHLHGVRLGRT